MKDSGSIYKPRKPPERFEEEKYEPLLDESGKPILRIVTKYKPKEYEQDGEEKELQTIHEKVGVQVIKSMLKNAQTPEIEPMELEDTGNKVFGTLFDKIRFLRVRIDELEQAIDDRKKMNRQSNSEIEHDIHDLEAFLEKLSAKEDIREFKLNISLLRMEKRKENNLYWRDITLLNKQLRELREEYETESNIAQLFSKVPGLKSGS